VSILKDTYLGLGSNQGNREGFLQQAIQLLAERVGMITKVSPVYQSKAVGFDGPDFLNLAVKLKTKLTPERLLHELMDIENYLGRKRSDSKAYESRTIDIDILFYDKEIIFSDKLIIPHPEIVNRAFVLYPMSDISPDFMHPLEKKPIKSLVTLLDHDASLTRTSIELEKPVNISELYNYIAIEGNIGAGKTTLTGMLSEDFNAKTVLERYADNAFLPKFYENEERYAFPLEMSFLADRYQQLSDDLAQFDLFKNFIISDYYIFKSLIFAQVTLSHDEYALYRRMFDIMYKEITKPDLYIYLYQNTDRLLENIKMRGRDYEQNISADYLKKIHKGYANFIQTEPHLNILVIDVSDMDFVKNPEDYRAIVKKILELEPKIDQA
jgi:2-amino-4-hydroxy-6-hydroxymethyldihydropteridine diphosphokinase